MKIIQKFILIFLLVRILENCLQDHFLVGRERTDGLTNGLTKPCCLPVTNQKETKND